MVRLDLFVLATGRHLGSNDIVDLIRSGGRITDSADSANSQRWFVLRQFILGAMAGIVVK